MPFILALPRPPPPPPPPALLLAEIPPPPPPAIAAKLKVLTLYLKYKVPGVVIVINVIVTESGVTNGVKVNSHVVLLSIKVLSKTIGARVVIGA